MSMRRAPVPVYLWLAGGSAACYWLVFTLNLVYQVKVIGLSPLQLVLVGTVLEASVFVGEVPTGIVADVYSRRLSILIGLVLVGAGLALGAVPSFAAVLVAQVLWGVGYTFTSGAQQAWLTDEVGTERIAAVFVRSTQAEMVGMIAGIVLAGALGLVWIGLPIVLGGAGFLALAAVLAVTMPEHGFTPTRLADRTTFATMAGQFREGLALARRRRVVRTLMLVSFTWMNRHVESGVRATVLSFEGQMNAVGQVVGGPALGAVGSAVSVRAALLGSAITLLPSAGLYAGTRSDG